MPAADRKGNAASDGPRRAFPGPSVLAGIRLIVLDVDGVLSDGRIILDERGKEYKSFDVHDGYGIRKAMEAGLRFAIISGRKSKVVPHRARLLGIPDVHLGAKDKLSVFRKLLAKHGLRAVEACCIGDDEPDLPILRAAGLSAAPSTAVAAVRAEVHVVTRVGGGRGAVREVIDLILGNGTRVAGSRRAGSRGE